MFRQSYGRGTAAGISRGFVLVRAVKNGSRGVFRMGMDSFMSHPFKDSARIMTAMMGNLLA